jgi:hypothetical protein
MSKSVTVAGNLLESSSNDDNAFLLNPTARNPKHALAFGTRVSALSATSSILNASIPLNALSSSSSSSSSLNAFELNRSVRNAGNANPLTLSIAFPLASNARSVALAGPAHNSSSARRRLNRASSVRSAGKRSTPRKENKPLDDTLSVVTCAKDGASAGARVNPRPDQSSASTAHVTTSASSSTGTPTGVIVCRCRALQSPARDA